MLACALFGAIHKATLFRHPAPKTKVFVGGGPDRFYNSAITIDLGREYGLSKTQGLVLVLRKASFDYGFIIVRTSEEDILRTPEKTVPRISAEPPLTAYDQRQQIFTLISSRVKSHKKLSLAMLPNEDPDFALFRFARILINQEKIDVRNMSVSWGHYISKKSYEYGLNSSQANLTKAFTWAVDSYSDTTEAQEALSLAMIKEDRSNPIAWWYLAGMDNNHLRPLIDLEWRAQLKPILARMGSWEIGKKYLTRRFEESH